jgi:hypothetical protein
VGQTGLASAAGQEAGRRPVKPKFHFSFINQIPDFLHRPKFKFLRRKKAFSKVDLKTKVAQNLILYNFDLGHFLKFPIYFELMI